jgi:hypothetical protein
MSIAAGTRLGPNEVLALIGKGGMDEVWRARDTKLSRDVLKIPPEAFATDPDRPARFNKADQGVVKLEDIEGFWSVVRGR